MDFPSGSDSKASVYNAGDLGLIPGLGRSPGEGKGYLLQYSGQENSDMTEQLSIFSIGYKLAYVFSSCMLLLLSRFSRVQLCATP